MKLRNPFKRKQKNLVDTDQGWMSTTWDQGWWQQNLKAPDVGKNETVEACVSTLSQTVAMLPVHHLVDSKDDGEERKYGSWAEKVLLKPNQYTSRSQFFNQIIRSMYFYGNGYAVATRDANRAINGLYVVDPRGTSGVIDQETGEVYYWVSAQPGRAFNPDEDNIYPARDVLNLRINPRRQEPLKGDTPITVAANSISANSSIIGHQSSFFSNMARPSGSMSTDQVLTKDQMLQLRDAVAEQTQGTNSGKIPIFGNGLKFETMSLTSQDSQMVQAFGMTVASISRVFRVPLAMINDLSNSTFNNSEQANAWFLSSGLGFLLEHIELELNTLFDLPFNQHLNFDPKALLRSDWKSQIEALSQGTINGIYSPDEARAFMGLGKTPDGDQPRVQQQVVPLSAWDMNLAPAPEPAPVDVAASFNKGYLNARKAS